MRKKNAKKRPAASRRLGKVAVLGVAILLIWQIAQIMTARTVGIPGLFTIPVNLIGGQPRVETASAPGGVTTIYKRVPAPQERPTGPPPPQANSRAQPLPPVLTPPATTPAEPEAPKAAERAAPAPQVLTRPETPALAPQVAPPAPERPKVVTAPPPPQPTAPVELPSRSDVESWIRSQAREFVGGVDADGLPLYRFDVWLDVPGEIGARIRTVNYEYIAPSAQPPAQVGNDRGSGFRVKFAGAACAEKLIVTVVMDDGRERKVEVDGCAVLN